MKPFVSRPNLSADCYTQDLLDFVQLYQKHCPSPHAAVQERAEIIDLDFIQNDLPKMLKSMEVGTERIRQIVLSLRNFSRMDESAVKAVDIREGIESTLLILQHRLERTSVQFPIQIVKEYGELPLVECYAGQLNQVFMNILANAIDAIEEWNAQRSYQDVQSKPGQITIRTAVIGEGWIQISISDNGPGMSKETNTKLFEPFFTTKSVGKGTGLGLSISYQIIVERHRGKLLCQSSPGEGAEFIILHFNVHIGHIL